MIDIFSAANQSNNRTIRHNQLVPATFDSIWLAEISSSPFLPLASLWWFHFGATLLDFVPVGAEGRTAALLIALHHGTPGVLVRIGKEFLEKLVYG